jgi:hypothetical protein
MALNHTERFKYLLKSGTNASNISQMNIKFKELVTIFAQSFVGELTIQRFND